MEYAEQAGDDTAAKDIIALMEANQQSLLAYIISILGSSTDADDALQETNIFLWENQHDYQPGTNFKAWAFRIAYFKAMSCRRNRARTRTVEFSESMLQRIAIHATNHLDQQKASRLDALQRCLAKLSGHERELISHKYEQKRSLVSYANTVGKSANALHKSISRIRLALRNCVEQSLSQSID